MDYDLIVIGGGPGGYTAALEAAGYGLKTALIERRELGGTCLNRGCIPTKTLLHGTELLHEVRQSDVFSVKAELDMKNLIAKKDRVVTSLREGIGTLLAGKHVDVIAGTGCIRDAHTVVCGEQVLTAENILIASGSKPAVLPIEGMDLQGVISSDGLFEEVPEKIGRLVIIGGGVIGTEIASVYAELGTQVTILEYLPYLLPVMDREIGRSLQMILKKRGIEVLCGAKVEKITRDEELHCHYVLKGKEQSVPADMVLVCTGRTADIDGLFEQKDMVAYDRGIVVDERFETSAEGIYAIGDVISGSIKLAHAASAQGRAAAAVIAGRELNINTAVIPACVYTSPEIAAVGLMPEDAKKAGIPVKTKKITMSANGRTMIADGERGFIRIIYGEDNVLLGAILMCERASDIVGMYTQAIVSRMTVEQLASAVMPHPSFVEASGELFASAE